MTIDKLTEGDRLYLGAQNTQHREGQRALAIIDALTAERDALEGTLAVALEDLNRKIGLLQEAKAARDAALLQAQRDAEMAAQWQEDCRIARSECDQWKARAEAAERRLKSVRELSVRNLRACDSPAEWSEVLEVCGE